MNNSISSKVLKYLMLAVIIYTIMKIINPSIDRKLLAQYVLVIVFTLFSIDSLLGGVRENFSLPKIKKNIKVDVCKNSSNPASCKRLYDLQQLIADKQNELNSLKCGKIKKKGNKKKCKDKEDNIKKEIERYNNEIESLKDVVFNEEEEVTKPINKILPIDNKKTIQPVVSNKYDVCKGNANIDSCKRLVDVTESIANKTKYVKNLKCTNVTNKKKCNRDKTVTNNEISALKTEQSKLKAIVYPKEETITTQPVNVTPVKTILPIASKPKAQPIYNIDYLISALYFIDSVFNKYAKDIINTGGIGAVNHFHGRLMQRLLVGNVIKGSDPNDAINSDTFSWYILGKKNNVFRAKCTVSDTKSKCENLVNKLQAELLSGFDWNWEQLKKEGNQIKNPDILNSILDGLDYETSCFLLSKHNFAFDASTSYHKKCMDNMYKYNDTNSCATQCNNTNYKKNVLCNAWGIGNDISGRCKSGCLFFCNKKKQYVPSQELEMEYVEEEKPTITVPIIDETGEENDVEVPVAEEESENTIQIPINTPMGEQVVNVEIIDEEDERPSIQIPVQDEDGNENVVNVLVKPKKPKSNIKNSLKSIKLPKVNKKAKTIFGSKNKNVVKPEVSETNDLVQIVPEEVSHVIPEEELIAVEDETGNTVVIAKPSVENKYLNTLSNNLVKDGKINNNDVNIIRTQLSSGQSSVKDAINKLENVQKQAPMSKPTMAKDFVVNKPRVITQPNMYVNNQPKMAKDFTSVLDNKYDETPIGMRRPIGQDIGRWPTPGEPKRKLDWTVPEARRPLCLQSKVDCRVCSIAGAGNGKFMQLKNWGNALSVDNIYLNRAWVENETVDTSGYIE